MTDYYIVWNHNKNEGFITSNEDDAGMAASGFHIGFGGSAAAQAFHEVYADDIDLDDDEDGEILEMEIKKVNIEHD